MEDFRGCLSSSCSGHVGVFPSKADRIMSRYRPIAPKPSMPSLSEADKSASSVITFDNLCARQVSDVPPSIAPPFSKQKSKRVRKRPIKDSDIQDSSKRLATGSVLNSMEKGMGRSLAADVAQLNILEDVGFMDRAAASAPSFVFPLEKARKPVPNNNYGYGGCFTEMIRGIAGLPSAAHVHNLLQQQQLQQRGVPDVLNVLMKEPTKQLAEEITLGGNSREERDYAREALSSDVFWSCFSGNMREYAEMGVSEEQQQSGLDEEKSDGEDDGRKRVVTLNLLPEAPLRGDSPTISTYSSSPKAVFEGTSNSLVYIESVYGRSLEPVFLVDDMSHAILWANQSYVKACEDNSGMAATFIDRLGIPTQLGQFQVQVDGQSECIVATLWGFLKTLVVDFRDEDVPSWLPSNACVSSESVKEAMSPSVYLKGCMSEQQLCGGMLLNSRQPMASMALDCLDSSRVITPRPVRLVGSIVSLESVTEVQFRDIVSGTWELSKKQLEEDNQPGFISDGGNVVRWVNTAYKAMVGQPECPWLVSTMKTGGESPTITGEVLLSCNVEVPHLATSFSGRANVQWTRITGERSCMTVPCDVSSLVDSKARRMLVWRFDIQASLSLTCGVER